MNEQFEIKIIGNGRGSHIVSALRQLARDLEQTEFFQAKNEITIEDDGPVLVTTIIPR